MKVTHITFVAVNNEGLWALLESKTLGWLIGQAASQDAATEVIRVNMRGNDGETATAFVTSNLAVANAIEAVVNAIPKKGVLR